MTYKNLLACAAAIGLSLATLTGCAAGGGGFLSQSGGSDLGGYSPGTLGYKAMQLGVPPVNGWSLWRPNGDVNGEVGHPISVYGPRGGGDCRGGWNAFTGLHSGRLPPGLSVDDSGDITGIPTERGHWIVTMRISNIQCNGHRYLLSGVPDVVVTQDGYWGNVEECKENGNNFCSLSTIRFHITGSGRVIQ